MKDGLRAWPSTLFAAIVLVGSLLLPGPARATTYAYDQTSASVPGLVISGLITVNGNLFDLPDTSSTANPIDFGNLLAFQISAPNALARSYTLNDFVATQTDGRYAGFPNWTIGGGPGIDFINAVDTEHFIITGGSIAINSDYDGICHMTGTCFAQGNWDPVPEPSTLATFAIGAAWLWVTAARRRRAGALQR